MAKSKKRTNQLVAIFLIWLFHVSAIVGITIGFNDWFLSKTPINLLICAALFLRIFPLDSPKKYGYFLLFFAMGMLAEWLGVNHGLLFGSYSYGSNLGYKVDGVPLFIGVNWALLTFITAVISGMISKNRWIKALIAASLMVFLDYFMEQNAPEFDFWDFGAHVPLSTYITWFILAYFLQLLFQYSRISGNRSISLNLYLAQLVFFTFFTLFPAQ